LQHGTITKRCLKIFDEDIKEIKDIQHRIEVALEDSANDFQKKYLKSNLEKLRRLKKLLAHGARAAGKFLFFIALIS